MKKFALIMVIAALSMFICQAALWADNFNWRRFHGIYEMAAKGNGLNSTGGFDKIANDFYVPKQGSIVWGSADVAYGTWTFNRDGSGKAEGMNYAFDFPPGNPALGGPIARNSEFYLEFDYDVTREGVITVTVTNLPIFFEMKGQVSKDRKTITLYNAYTFLGPNSIFMASRVLIKVGNNAEED